ncbi:MAG: TolC family protein, partial [bacterium]|nr:TolC family protein [bacterium]
RKNKPAGTQEKKDTFAYSISGSQLIFDGFKTSNNVAEANQNLIANQYDYAVVSSNVRLNLRTAFSELLRAQELICLTEEIVERRKQNLALVELRYEVGREHRGSFLTARADLAEAEFEAKQAKRNILFAQTKLIKQIGWEEKVPVEVDGVFKATENFSDDPDFEYLADNNPFLKELAAKKDASRYGLKSSKSDLFPEVYLTSSAARTGPKWPPREEEWGVGFSVSFPLFEGGRRISEISRAEAEVKEALAEERSGRDSIIVTLEKTWVGFQDAVDNVVVREKFLEAAEERAKIARAEYSTGIINFDDWIIIEDNLVSTKKSYLNARANMLISEAEWVQAKGGTLGYE